MEYPKMLYRSEQRFADDEAVKMAMGSGIQQIIVTSEEEEVAQLEAGAVVSPSDLIGEPPKRRKKAAEPVQSTDPQE